MATTVTPTFTTPRPETHHSFGAAAIAFCARFADATRLRHEQRRMMLTVQELDHSGVLADMEATCRMQRD